jgi:predicted PurR-regulated permease PerM
MLAIVFFWLTEHARLQRYVLAFLPADTRQGARATWNEIETRLGGWVRGQLLIMGTVGAAAGAAYFLLGLEGWAFLALFAALAEAVPIVGPLVGAVPALLVAAGTSPELALVVAVVYVIIQVVEGNVLIPLIMRNTVGISPFLVIVSILVGAAVGGVIGAILAVPMVAAFEIILERLQARDVPISQDSGSTQVPDEAIKDDARRTLPDSRDTAAI